MENADTVISLSRVPNGDGSPHEPTALSGGNYRFNYSPTNNIAEFYRIEGL